MKHPLHYLRQIFFFILIISVSSCEKEELTDEPLSSDVTENIQPKVKISTKSLAQFIEEDAKFKRSYSKFTSKRKGTQLKEGSDFEVNPSKVIKVEDSEKTTYTVAITKEDTPVGTFDNLVIDVDEDETMQTYILSYIPDAEGIVEFTNDSVSFKGTMTVTPIDYDASDLLSQRITVIYITIMYCDVYGTTHLAGSGCTGPYPVTFAIPIGSSGSNAASQNNNGIVIVGNQNMPDPNFGGGGSMGGGPTSVPIMGEEENIIKKRNVVIEALKLNFLQKLWVNDNNNNEAVKNIFKFLGENQLSDESTDFAKEAVEKFMNYTQTNYPGKAEGLPYKWWLQHNLNTTGDFFKMPSDLPNAPLEDPNAKELLLFAMFPDFAILHRNNSMTAVDISYHLAEIDFFSEGGSTLKSYYNGKSDAFRHAFWNALDTAEFGEVVTKLFTDAHEYGQTGIDVNMDLNNNKVGRDIANNYNFSFSTPDNVISNAVKQAVLNGELRYISPTHSDGKIMPTLSLIIPTNQ